jgi:hypothetical protein
MHIGVMMVLVDFRIVYVDAFSRSPLKESTLLLFVQCQRGKCDQYLQGQKAVNPKTERHIFQMRTHLANQRRQFDAVRVLLWA